jgi:hypothetical protein
MLTPRLLGALLVALAAGQQPSAARAALAPEEKAVAPAKDNRSPAPIAPIAKAVLGEPYRLPVAEAVMVTVELDFGPKVPSIADALQQIERRSQPEDGTGRTFAILDAYGDATPQGKLHLSMHLSAEKPGLAALIFKRTGETLWRGQIVKGTNATPSSLARRGLVILLDNGAGKTVTVDGSNNPRSILEAKVKEMAATIGDIWPEGSEREVTFLYSACGCPVKVLAMRVGDKTMRTRHLPVIFPDDPAVVAVIKRVMRWE